MSLPILTHAARTERPCWDDERAGRVLAATLVRRDKRDARSRLLRRSLAVTSAAAVVVFILLRGAGASTSTSTSTSTSSADNNSNNDNTTATSQAMLAAHDRNGDGGYGRD